MPLTPLARLANACLLAFFLTSLIPIREDSWLLGRETIAVNHHCPSGPAFLQWQEGGEEVDGLLPGYRAGIATRPLSSSLGRTGEELS